MRYTIEGFSQPKLVELGLNANDAHVLRWFVDFQNTGRMKVRDTGGIPHYFVHYEKVLEDLPILGITSTRSAARIFAKLADAGILAKREVKNHHGTTLWFSFGPAYESLLAGEPADKSVPASFAPDNSVQCGPDNSVSSAPDNFVPSYSSIRDSIPAIAAPTAQQLENECAVLLAEIKRLQKIKPTSAFLANAKAAVELGKGLTENQQATLNAMSREKPSKEVAKKTGAPSKEELAARLVANDGREYDPDDLKNWEDEFADRAELKKSGEIQLTVEYTDRAMVLTGTKNWLELRKWAERAGIELDWENMRATVDAINRRNEEREPMDWPAADVSQRTGSVNERAKQPA